MTRCLAREQSSLKSTSLCKVSTLSLFAKSLIVVCVESVSEVVKGFNSTIFAYGQTGSGKTFTMFGPHWDDN